MFTVYKSLLPQKVWHLSLDNADPLVLKNGGFLYCL